MADKFEILKTSKASSTQLRRTIRNMRGVPAGLKLDPSRAQALTIGSHLWTFILTRESAANWDKLGTEPMTVGVIASGLDRPYLQRVLVALPDEGRKVKLEMHDANGALLWTGSGVVEGDELEFSMPISRPGVKEKGMMAGRISSNGQMTLSDSRLPRPARKRSPTLVSED